MTLFDQLNLARKIPVLHLGWKEKHVERFSIVNPVLEIPLINLNPPILVSLH